jgi:hypothetical protein
MLSVKPEWEVEMYQVEKKLAGSAQGVWPSLLYEEWKDTYATLQRWVQIVGRVRAALSPNLNSWWHTTLYVTPRGLTSSPIPCGIRTFELTFDLIAHQLLVQTSDGMTRDLALTARPVADFYRELMAVLGSLEVLVQIDRLPHRPAEPIPYDQDRQHASYDPQAVERFRRILVQCDRVFKQFRAGFTGKCSPVHFWPGSFDLAVTRYSGRKVKPGASPEDDSAFELSSAGFWPGSGSLKKPAFYAYTTPAPAGITKARIRPKSASYNADFGEFILAYDDIRDAAQPEAALLEFLQSTYEAGADLGKWDRRLLESESS